MKPGDLVRLVGTPIDPSGGVRNGMVGEVIATYQVRKFLDGHWRSQWYVFAMMGECRVVAEIKYFDLVLTGAGGSEPVKWDWRSLTQGATRK